MGFRGCSGEYLPKMRLFLFADWLSTGLLQVCVRMGRPLVMILTSRSSPRASRKTHGYACGGLCGRELNKRGVKVGSAVSEALRTMEGSDLARAVRVRPCTPFSGGLLLRLFCRYPGQRRRSLRRLPRRPSPFVTRQHTRLWQRRSLTCSMILAWRSMPGSRRRRCGGAGGALRQPETPPISLTRYLWERKIDYYCVL